MGKKFYRKLILVCAVIFLFIFYATAWSQSLGNPMTLQKNTWSMGLNADFVKYILDNHEYTFSRGIIKTDFAVTSFLDVAVLLGSTNMRILFPVESQLEELKSKMEFLYGASVKMKIPVPLIRSQALFIEGGMIGYKAQGETQSTSVLTPGEYRMKYLLREFWGTFGTIYSTRPFDVYIAVQKRAFHQNELLMHSEYRSGLKPSVVFGVDFRLNERHAFNMQLRILNGITFSFGISQYVFWRK